jgi:hypothetical protein
VKVSISANRRSVLLGYCVASPAVLVLIASVLVLVGSRRAGATVLHTGYPPTIADPSDWNFKYIYESGLVQDGAFRLEDEMIYHIGSPNAVGKAYFDGDGYLHIEFYTHRKIGNGEAVVQNVKPGHWRGTLFINGQAATFDMKKRCGDCLGTNVAIDSTASRSSFRNRRRSLKAAPRLRGHVLASSLENETSGKIRCQMLMARPRDPTFESDPGISRSFIANGPSGKVTSLTQGIIFGMSKPRKAEVLPKGFRSL